MKLAQKLAVNYLRARLNLLAVLSTRRAAGQAYRLFCTPYHKYNRQSPPVFEQASPLTIHVKGIAVNGFRWNKGGIKKVLILHGFESSCKKFDAYIKELVKKNYEVLAFDAPAHGISGGKFITLPLYIDMITAIHFQFGIVQSFMGHSFGALAAAHFIEKIPHDANTKLVLVAPATELNTAIDTFFRFLQLPRGVRTEFEKIIQAKSGVAPGYFSVPRAVQHLKAEILWVHDRNDDITPFKDVEPVMTPHQPNLHFFITEGLGHKKIYRDSHVIKMVVDFL